MGRRKAQPEPQAPAPQAKGRGRKSRTPQTQPVMMDQLLTITQVAARLGLGRTKVYELINHNLLPFVSIPGNGETKRVSAITLNTWIKERETVKHAS